MQRFFGKLFNGSRQTNKARAAKGGLRRPSLRLAVESLEDRLVPTGIQLTSGVLTITGTKNDTIAVQAVQMSGTNFLQATLDNTTQLFAASAVHSIKITTGSGSNSVDLKSVFPVTSISVTSTGTNSNDTVTIEGGVENPEFVPTITVTNPNGNTALQVDTSSAGDQHTTVTNKSITVFTPNDGETSGKTEVVNYTAPTKTGGHGVNSVRLFATFTGTSEGQFFSEVDVVSTAAAASLALDGTTTNMTVHIGNDYQQTSGSLANIAGPVNLSYASGATKLDVNNSAGPANTGSITSSGITGMSAGAISFSPSGGVNGVTGITVQGAAAENFNVLSTAAAPRSRSRRWAPVRSTSATTGRWRRSWRINVSNSSGATTLVLNDQKESGSRHVTVQNNEITGMAPAAISFTPATAKQTGVNVVNLFTNPQDVVKILEFSPFITINDTP